MQALVFALWLLTVLMGLWEVRALYELFGWAYAHLVVRGLADHRAGEAIGQALLILLALAYLAFAIVTAEFRRAHCGKWVSWRVFGVTLAVQAAVASLALVTGTSI
ncbi:MAG: hypothetical protein RMM31_07105 [Anaerolineae bacterium]|nr:hypothetical protein [Anaerolineae bacterium]